MHLDGRPESYYLLNEFDMYEIDFTISILFAVLNGYSAPRFHYWRKKQKERIFCSSGIAFHLIQISFGSFMLEENYNEN